MQLAMELVEREGSRKRVRRPRHPDILVRDYERGLTIAEISKRYELTRSMVENVLEEAGVEIRRRQQIDPKVTMLLEPPAGRGRPSLTPENPQILVDKYKEGNTIEEIAQECGLTRYLVRKTLLDEKVKLTRGHPGKAAYRKGKEEREKRINKILSMRQRGMTLRAVGKELGLSYERVRKILLNAGHETSRKKPDLI